MCRRMPGPLHDNIRNECPLLGKRVVITGTSRQDLNGRTRLATSFGHDHDRYLVELDGQRGEKQKGKFRLKPGNLALVDRRRQYPHRHQVMHLVARRKASSLQIP